MSASRSALFVVLFVLLSVAHSSPVAAQTTNATLSGTVYDAQKAVVPGATVTATHVETARTSVAVTNVDGQYRLVALTPGEYRLDVELDGFSRFAQSGIVLRIAQEATVLVTLQMAGVSEAVTVTAVAEGIDTTSAKIAPVVTRAELDALPVAGRDFSSLAVLVPGVSSVGGGNVAAGGQEANQTGYLLDGVNNTAPNLGNARGSVTLESVQEFQVITNQFSAEYGQASGAVVSAITRGGSNTTRGRVFLFFSDDSLNGSDPFATSGEAPFSQQRYGGFLGGPILHDRLFYFASLEVQRARTTNVVVSPLAAPDQRQYTQEDDRPQPFGRVDWSISRTQSLWARYRFDRASTKGAGIGGLNTISRGYNDYETNQDVTVFHGYVPNSRILNEFRFSGGYRHLVRDSIGFDPNAPGYDMTNFTINRPSGNLGPQANTNWLTEAPTYIFTESFSYFIGGHGIKLGAEVQLYRGGLGSPTNVVGTYTFNTDAPFNPNVSSTYPTQFTQTVIPDFPRAYIALPDEKYVLYAQDQWRTGKGVTLNFGIRLDKDMAWKKVAKLDIGTQWYISPRLGVAWDPLGDGKTVVRGGYGTYYDQLLLNPALTVARNQAWTYNTITKPGYPNPYSTGSLVAPTLTVVSPDLTTPYTRTTTLGVQRMLGRQISVSVDGVYTQGLNQYYAVDLNSPVNGVRPNSKYGLLREYRTGADSRYSALLLGVSRRQGTLRWGASYTLAKAEDESDGWTNIPQDGSNLAAELGPTTGSRTHQLVMNLTAALPAGFQAGMIFKYRSGVPYNITTGNDNNGDSQRTDRPDLAVPGGDPTDKATFFSAFTGRVGNLSRNYGVGPDYSSVDLRVSKSFRMKAVNIEVLAEAFNLFNQVNLGPPNGNLLSSLFGQSTAIVGAQREIQLGFRLDFPGR